MNIEFDNHFTWLEAANELKISSEILKKELIQCKKGQGEASALAYFNSYMLLLGFHFENYLKGKSLQIFKLSSNYIAPTSFEDLKKIWQIKKNGHDLCNIYKSCGIEMKEMEMNFLSRLETHVEYAGRYKTPKHMNGWKFDHRIIKNTDTIIEEQIKLRIELKINNG